jgi:hypothetical protein
MRPGGGEQTGVTIGHHATLIQPIDTPGIHNMFMRLDDRREAEYRMVYRMTYSECWVQAVILPYAMVSDIV